jgi:hypothetical protein
MIGRLLFDAPTEKTPFHADELPQKEFYDSEKLLKTTFVKRVRDENGKRVEAAKKQMVKI